MPAEAKMKTKGNKRFWFVPLVLFAWVFFVLPLRPVLVLESGNTTRVYPLGEGETFAIRYIHSVNKSPVVDTIAREQDQLVVKSSLFQAYGAGIPSDADQIGDLARLTEDGFLMEGIDAAHDEIALITGTISDHHLLLGDGREIRLKDAFGERQPVTLRAAKLPLYCEAMGKYPAPWGEKSDRMRKKGKG